LKQSSIIPDAGASSRWRAVASDTLHFAHWEGQSILFHEPSGRTHLLNESMVDLLTRILREPRTMIEAFQQLSVDAPADPDGDVEAQARVQDALLWLEELGLVERS
jgi:PqqD family protein of HPr-rel-A system